LTELSLDYRSDGFVVVINCFWALYNIGLATSMLYQNNLKRSQHRSTFRVPDSIPARFRNGDNGTEWHPAVINNLTVNGTSLLIIGQPFVATTIELEILLPGRAVPVRANVVQARSVNYNGHAIFQVGASFETGQQGAKDAIGRFIHESAITRFLHEYSTRYKTFIEKHFRKKQHLAERTLRRLAYLPAAVSPYSGKPDLCVIKAVSENGILVKIRSLKPVGSPLQMELLLGEEKIPISGVVVRNLIEPGGRYLEYFSGIRLDEKSHKIMPRILGLADKIGELASL
jgi:hypothetical protein